MQQTHYTLLTWEWWDLVHAGYFSVGNTVRKISRLKKRLHTDLYFKRNSCRSYMSRFLTSTMMDASREYFHFLNALSNFCLALLGRYSYPLTISIILSIFASSGCSTLKKTSCLQICLNFCKSGEGRFLSCEGSAGCSSGSFSFWCLQQGLSASCHWVSFLSSLCSLCSVTSFSLECSCSRHRVPEGNTCFLPCVKKTTCKHLHHIFIKKILIKCGKLWFMCEPLKDTHMKMLEKWPWWNLVLNNLTLHI